MGAAAGLIALSGVAHASDEVLSEWRLFTKSTPIVVIFVWLAPSGGHFGSNHTLALRSYEREPSTCD